jgi:hypothetical protein
MVCNRDVLIMIQLVMIIAMAFGIRGMQQEYRTLEESYAGVKASNEYLLELVETMDDWISPKRSGELQ